jgi:N-acetylglutamate synthase-like GNAT family acetyltransferase
MEKSISIEDINIRTDLRPGDIGYITYLHGILYNLEYQYSVAFESYVAEGLHEFYIQYNPEINRVWVCEHNNKIIGFLLLMYRSQFIAQLRYFILVPEYRGLGLGKLLMDNYIKFLKEAKYQSSYLWTTSELEVAASLYLRYGFRLTEEKQSTVFGKAIKEQRYDLVVV